jgi:2,3-bisphosphoglycerate-independent phosphoglycerate mutase
MASNLKPPDYLCAMEKKVILLILDGWGHGRKDNSDAIFHAHTPFVDSLYQDYPHAELQTSGESVGLPEGQMGNSEVGHLNIGAGRVIYQQLVIINKAFTEKTIRNNRVLQDAFNYARINNKRVHLIGLVSDGGVHSSIDHLKGLCDLASENKLDKVFIHAFLDGRDTDPQSGAAFISSLQQHTTGTAVKLASAVGRYYAMDRDKRWERVKIAYDLLVHGTGNKTSGLVAAIKEQYQAGITDEFMKPLVVVDQQAEPLAVIEDGDVVINFNFRTDRGRQITQALTQQDFHEQNMHRLDLYYVTMTSYDQTYNNVKVIFDNKDIELTLGEVIANNNLKQLRAAETEKYPHVTFFFSGGREHVFEGENRIMAPSPKVATYDLMPEMSAELLKEKIIPEIRSGQYSFIVVNFANPDMVGHTGIFDAVKKAVETVDNCAGEIVREALEQDYSIIVIADHGNAEYMINDDGSPNTAHTTNPVPIFFIDNKLKMRLKNGRLADIAPTILYLMGLEKPEQMTGEVLLN